MEKTIEIPEGYEARIEGNKVIIERKKSDDERIREVIESIIRVYGKAQGEWLAGYDMDTLVVHLRDAFAYLERQKEQQPAGWSEEDEKRVVELKTFIAQCNGFNKANRQKAFELIDVIRSQPKQESEPLEIKYAEKIYKVYGTKELPGGVVGYIIEDEPGHYDCIIHPDEVLGGGYGIKSNGSPYPTKEANFGQPHWKPSKEQMEHLAKGIIILGEEGYGKTSAALNELRNDLKKLLQS